MIITMIIISAIMMIIAGLPTVSWVCGPSAHDSLAAASWNPPTTSTNLLQKHQHQPKMLQKHQHQPKQISLGPTVLYNVPPPGTNLLKNQHQQQQKFRKLGSSTSTNLLHKYQRQHTPRTRQHQRIHVCEAIFLHKHQHQPW